MKRLTCFACMILILFIFASCKSILPTDSITKNNKGFTQTDENAPEAFRVLVVSDRYIVTQNKFSDTIKRSPDIEGDTKTSADLKIYDKIDETVESSVEVSLFPDSGKISKIRTNDIAPIEEINRLVMNDIKRWIFEFPTEKIEPTTLIIKYRFVLRKIQPDELTMKEVEEKLKKDEEKKKQKEKARE